MKMSSAMKICISRFIFLIVATQVSAFSNHSDVTALQALQSIWNNALLKWAGGDPCGDLWFGITCTGNRVVSISLTGVNLIGNLSSDIAKISQLQHLDLSCNPGLTGPLPPEIGNLVNLGFLNLAGCGFFGPVPSSIGNLLQLRTLSLNSNNFSGQIPGSIGNLCNLYWLDLSSNKLSGNIPVSNENSPGLDNLTNTSHFHFQDNELSGSIPPQLFRLGMALVHLVLYKNQLSGIIPSSLGFAQYLETLRLDENSLSGPVPDLTSLNSLAVLQLENNNLSGPLPNLTGMNELAYVDMSNNPFDPTDFPPWFSSLQSLTTLILENIQIQGQLGIFFFELVQLQTVRMKNNNITGNLDMGSNPSSQLQLVDLQNNSIAAFPIVRQYGFDIILSGNPVCNEGTLGSQYCSITDQQHLNSSPPYSTPRENCIPPSCVSKMTSSPTCICSYPFTLDLIFNDPTFSDLENSTFFEAFQTALQSTFRNMELPVDSVSLRNLSWDTWNNLVITVDIFPRGQKKFNNSEVLVIFSVLTSRSFQPPPVFGGLYYLGSYPPFGRQSQKLNIGVVIGATIVGFALFLLLIVIGIYALGQRKIARIASRRSDPFALWVPNSHAGGVPQLQGAKYFSFDEVKQYTRNFSSVNVIGSGGYGKVYRGILPGGQLVAIKRAVHGSMQGGLEFKTEIELLSRVHHRNLVSLVGFCFDQGEQMLVYEYIANGTLKTILSGISGIRLWWSRRIKIGLGVARGLHYLHELADPPIIHRDIKSSNILLDDRLNAKVADFGLSKSLPALGNIHITTQVKGTMGYLDPEYYMTQQLTEKSDVYSFGVLLLELLTGRSPIERGKYIVREVKEAMDANKPFCGLQNLIDPNMGTVSSSSAASVERFVHVALRCVEEHRLNRPAMSAVVKEMEKIMETLGLDPAAESESSCSGEGGRTFAPVHPYSTESLASFSAGTFS